MKNFIKRIFRKTIVMDCNILPSEYKDAGKITKELIEKYEDDYDVNILPIDASPKNIRGANINLIQKI